MVKLTVSLTTQQNFRIISADVRGEVAVGAHEESVRAGLQRVAVSR